MEAVTGQFLAIFAIFGNFKSQAQMQIGFTCSHFKWPALELLHNVSPDSQNSYAELITALELQYGDKHLVTVFQSHQQFEASIDLLVRLGYP